MEPKSRGRDYLAKARKAMAGAKITAKINSGAMVPHPAPQGRSTMEKMPVITNVPTAKPKLTGRENALARGAGQKVGLRSKMEQMPTITNAAARAVKQKAVAAPARPKAKRSKLSIPRPPRRTAKDRGLLDNWRP